MPRVAPPALFARPASTALAAALLVLLAACGNPPPSSDDGSGSSRPPAATPGPVGEKLGILPGVEGFAYREEPAIAPGFVDGVNESTENAAEVAILEAAIASRGDDEVSVIAFGFPGVSDDTQAVDSFARTVDTMEDALQVGAERGLGGEGYVLTSEGRTVILAPWARTDFLVFLFFDGPTDATQDLAGAILNAVD
jgi:hypothetical protein